jgi:hypothetical protein
MQFSQKFQHSNIRMKWVRHVAHMGEMRNAYPILVGNPEWERPLKRP